MQSPQNILIVDDDPDTLESLTGLLESNLQDVTVFGACDAEEAREMLAQTHMDLVVSDYRMPGENGVDFLSNLAGPTIVVPKILMTAHPALGLAVRALQEAGISALAVKPFEANDIVELVKGVLARPRSAFGYLSPR